MAEVGVKRRKRDWGPGGTDRTLRQAREESVTALLAKTDKGKPRPLMWKLLVSYVVDKGPLIQRLTAFVKLWVKNGLGEDDYEFLEDFLNAYGSFMVDATQELTLRERCWRYIEWNAFMGVAEIADPDHPESCTPSEGRGISDRHAVKAASDAFLYALKGDDTIGGYGASPNDSPLLKGVGQHVHSVVADILWTQMSKPEQLIDILTCDDDVEGDAEESEFAAQMGKTGSVGGEDSAQTGTTSGESEQLIAGDACLREKRKRDVEENSSNKRMLCEAAATLLGSSGGVECEAAAALLGSSAAAGKAAASGGFTGNGKASWSSNLTTTEVFNVGGCEKSQSGASASVGAAMSTTDGNGNQQKRKNKSGDQRRKEKKLAGVPKEQLRPSQRQRAKMKIALASSSSNNSKGAPVASSESRAAVSM